VATKQTAHRATATPAFGNFSLSNSLLATNVSVCECYNRQSTSTGNFQFIDDGKPQIGNRIFMVCARHDRCSPREGFSKEDFDPREHWSSNGRIRPD